MGTRQIALIRGINVGKAKRIEMAGLRDLFLELGYQDVSTVLNSGNVLFSAGAKSAGALEKTIEAGIVKTFGFPAAVVVISVAELAEMVKEHPFPEIDAIPSRLMVSVLKRPTDRARLTPLLEQDWRPDGLVLGTRAAYLWCPEGILESPLAKAVTRVLGEYSTTRNWGTMTRLHELSKTKT